ncbi:MAG TPA: hypothetical protein ENH92_06280 [Ectothiorhodospiraceae bacterium]|nr:hypothetical protein [Ectothiorhodospiraceae bacterium]
MSELGFWDYLTLTVALGVIVLYIAVRIKRLLNPGERGCSGCSVYRNAEGCSTESMDSCHTKPSTTESIIKQRK